MTYRFLEHTADALVECEAGAYPGILKAAADALYAVALAEHGVGVEVERRVEVTGESREDLLVRWLQELLFLLETDHFVASEFAFDDAGDGAVSARLQGYTCPPEARAAEVKSATYHELSVRETADGFVARFILDV
ncbi:MAG: hypothetical protein GWP08_03245 [Nitrospiraceae bacterium]|nr:hypothetical protein [Nitrospiraceae bacterium]